MLKENAVLMEREWESDTLIKEKLRKQGSREHESFGTRLIHGIINFHKFLPFYERYFKYYILDKKRRRRVLIAVTVSFVVAIGLVASGVVRSEFFPVSDQDYVYVDVTAPVGTRLGETDMQVRNVEEKLLGYKDIANFSTTIGRGNPMSGSGAGNSSNLRTSFVLTSRHPRLRDLRSPFRTLREDLLRAPPSKAASSGTISRP